MELSWIDTHSHLYADEFQEDLNEVIQRLDEQNIERVYLPNIDAESIPKMYKLQDLDKKRFIPMMGLHPCSVQPETYQKELEIMAKELEQKSFAAIGEIGIDLYWDKSTHAIQEEAFIIQCKWALAMDLPIIIHSRNSTNEIIQLLKTDELNPAKTGLKGIFHCFSGSKQEAETLIQMGFYLGLGGVLTFKNSGLAEQIKDISLKHLVLETDAPYLTPTPYRGKRNESSYIPLIGQKLAEVKGVTVEEVAQVTYQNAIDIFKL